MEPTTNTDAFRSSLPQIFPRPLPEQTRTDPWETTAPPATERRTRWVLPLVLFVATCFSTFLLGGPPYMLALMTILTAHELGHYFQARRYGVPATLPYFLPMPLTPIGTMGAVIAMRPQTANRRALFDLAITGPIAGLIPSVVLSFIGLRLSEVTPADAVDGLKLGEPLVFKLLSYLALGPVAEGYDVLLHPLAYAGWVGFFITALNLLPIGQLDGGHILYALVPAKAPRISTVLFFAAVAGVVAGGYWHWSLMIMLLALLGVRHPPTAGDDVELGREIGRASCRERV